MMCGCACLLSCEGCTVLYGENYCARVVSLDDLWHHPPVLHVAAVANIELTALYIKRYLTS